MKSLSLLDDDLPDSFEPHFYAANGNAEESRLALFESSRWVARLTADYVTMDEWRQFDVWRRSSGLNEDTFDYVFEIWSLMANIGDPARSRLLSCAESNVPVHYQ